ncbi:amino acid/amide ABC transporter membrane protein 1, HAAT family [Pseudooceanicola antarcticus]|uniref:Amino acid/amide ABC transporter membrane protein 1, HAAT family n=1 Tax=Pseudooceanicola antarcticus TaxID=1247613 RepID=A0A285JBK8_9RHOB|nr:branched-chain amino acid ABC transporter permease [Pseudooceanicola antarcticus]PJE30884.1 branched-chain amino acid ABC transporter permease [Pseudooceanicola antarcticus]SNY57625.1 amino acid/amide ABC transporter membrane protein 1, HAAT family [Pseudooceanicola antarcticus]
MDFGPYLMLAMLEGAVLAAVLALMASGLSLVFGVMRVVNVAHGEFYMLGAVMAWVVTQFMAGLGGGAAVNFIAAAVLAPLIVGTIAAAADITILKRLDYDPERVIVATIGVLYIIQQASLMGYGPDAKPVIAPFNSRIALPWFEFGEEGFQIYFPWGLSTTSYKLFVIVAAVVLLFALRLFMTRSRAGLIMRATQLDGEMATAFGIPVERVYAIVFGAGAALAALAGVLIVPIQQAHYLMGGDALLLSFIVVIIGGLGSLAGTVVAAVIIGMSDGIISVFFTPTLAKIIATLAVALVLVFRPQGLFGVKSR